jgi:6-phosphogluconolactonase
MSARRMIAACDTAAADDCAREMLSLLAVARDSAGKASLAISGGSSPKHMFAKMAATPFDWTGVHVFFVDERCVPPTDPASNFKMASQHLIVPARIPASQVHRMAGEADPQEGAKRYAGELAAFFGNGIPHFDVIHRGVGPDAHTASLFPDDPLINDRTGTVAATYAAKFRQWRITLLPAVLLAAKNTLVLAPGGDKAEALEHIFGTEYNPLKYPAQLGLGEDIEMTWFLTSE